MEKKEMSFSDKFEAAGKELEKEIKDGAAMILIATNGVDETYVNIDGSIKGISALLVFAAIKSEVFEEILANVVKGIELYKGKHNK